MTKTTCTTISLPYSSFGYEHCKDLSPFTRSFETNPFAKFIRDPTALCCWSLNKIVSTISVGRFLQQNNTEAVGELGEVGAKGERTIVIDAASGGWMEWWWCRFQSVNKQLYCLIRNYVYSELNGAIRGEISFCLMLPL